MRNALWIAVAAVCFLAFGTATHAGSFGSAGVKAGINLGNMGGDDTENIDAKYKAGFAVGGFVDYGISDIVSIRPGLDIVRRGIKKEYIEDFGGGPIQTTETATFTYLEIPVLVKFTIPTSGKFMPSLYVGPTIGINLSARDKYEPEGTDAMEYDISNVKTTDFSGTIGGEVRLPIGRNYLLFDISYSMSFGTSFDDIDPGDPPKVGSGEIAYADYTTGEAEDLVHKGIRFQVGFAIPLGK